MLMKSRGQVAQDHSLSREVYVPCLPGNLFLRQVSSSISPEAVFILQYRDCFQRQAEYCWLTLTTPREHGFTEGYDLLEFYEAVKASGLRLVPAGVGPMLRSQYLAQPEGESVHIGMDPVPDSGGGLNVFSLDHAMHGNGLWLSTLRWHYDVREFLSVDTPWLFGL